jgi:hypothetical protein
MPRLFWLPAMSLSFHYPLHDIHLVSGGRRTSALLPVAVRRRSNAPAAIVSISYYPNLERMHKILLFRSASRCQCSFNIL